MLVFTAFYSILLHDGFAQRLENKGILKEEGRTLLFFSPLLYQLSYLAVKKSFTAITARIVSAGQFKINDNFNFC